MLEEKPLQMQFNEKKEIENLSTSNNDTQACSQSLNTKIILDSSNSQELIVNIVSLVIIETRIEELEAEIEELKQANTKFLEDTEKKKKEKTEMLTKILEIADKYGLNKKQKEELINNAIKMANEFRKQNKKGK